MIATAIEALARGQGWLQSQYAHEWTAHPLIHVVHDDHRARVWTRERPTWQGIDLPTAALWILLAVSGLPSVDLGSCPACQGDPPRYGTGASSKRRCDQCNGTGRDARTPAQLVLDATARTFGHAWLADLDIVEQAHAIVHASRTPYTLAETQRLLRLRKTYAPDKDDEWALDEPARLGLDISGFERHLTARWRPRKPDARAREAMANLAEQLRAEASVLADRWQADGVGLSTERVPEDVFARHEIRCSVGDEYTHCAARAEWMWITRVRNPDGFGGGRGPFYCHEHRPADGFGHDLAVALSEPASFWDLDDEHAHLTQHAPGLWSLIVRWLDGTWDSDDRAERGRMEFDLEWALRGAIARCPTACKACRAVGALDSRGAYAAARCPSCQGTGRIESAGNNPAHV